MKPTVDVLDLDCSCGHVLRVHLEENAEGNLDISTRGEDACRSHAIASTEELTDVDRNNLDWAAKHIPKLDAKIETLEARLERVRKIVNVLEPGTMLREQFERVLEGE